MFQVPGRRAASLRIGRYTNFLDTTAADYVTTDVNDDGIWNAFVHLGLIED